jgi:hypothetical protein
MAFFYGIDCKPWLKNGVVIETVPEDMPAEEILAAPEKNVFADALGVRHLFPGKGSDVNKGTCLLETVVHPPEPSPFILDWISAYFHVLLRQGTQCVDIEIFHICMLLDSSGNKIECSLNISSSKTFICLRESWEAVLG